MEYESPNSKGYRWPFRYSDPLPGVEVTGFVVGGSGSGPQPFWTVCPGSVRLVP